MKFPLFTHTKLNKKNIIYRFAFLQYNSAFNLCIYISAKQGLGNG